MNRLIMEIKSIQEQEAEIIAEFAMFEDWMDKYNYLIEMGREIPLIDQKFKIDQNLISGCQSRVWLQAKYENERIAFTADSDAVITKGIANLLIRVMNNQAVDDIINAEFLFIASLFNSSNSANS